MAIETVFVTGATGKTGRRVVEILRERGVAVKAASRSGEVRFDWQDDSGWATAVAGADAAYLVMPESGSQNAIDQLTRFVAIARPAGVSRAVLISVPTTGGPPADLVEGAEQVLAESGLDWTSLRLRWFSQNFSEDFLLDGIVAGELRVPAGDGKEAFIDADDIAEVAVAALVDDGHSGQVYELTGPRLLTFGDAVDEISAAAGRDIRYVALTADEYAAELRGYGAPEEWVEMSSVIYGALRNGQLESVSDDVEKVLGRPARDFSDFVRAAEATGVWTPQD